MFHSNFLHFKSHLCHKGSAFTSNKPSDPECCVIFCQVHSHAASLYSVFYFLHPLTSQYMYKPTDGKLRYNDLNHLTLP